MKNLWRVFSRGCVFVCVDLSFLRITVNPWTTWISTMWVHSHVEIFNSKYYSNTWSTAGWICGRGTTDTQVQRNWEHTGPGACGNVKVMNMWMVYQALEMMYLRTGWRQRKESRTELWILQHAKVRKTRKQITSVMLQKSNQVFEEEEINYVK